MSYTEVANAAAGEGNRASELPLNGEEQRRLTQMAEAMNAMNDKLELSPRSGLNTGTHPRRAHATPAEGSASKISQEAASANASSPSGERALLAAMRAQLENMGTALMNKDSEIEELRARLQRGAVRINTLQREKDEATARALTAQRDLSHTCETMQALQAQKRCEQGDSMTIETLQQMVVASHKALISERDAKVRLQVLLAGSRTDKGLLAQASENSISGVAAAGCADVGTGAADGGLAGGYAVLDALTGTEAERMREALQNIEEMNAELSKAQNDGKAGHRSSLSPEPECGSSDSIQAVGRDSLDLHQLSSAVPSSPSSVAATPARNVMSPSSFVKLGLLGKGAVGKCYLVRQKGSNTLYAMKVMGKADILKRVKRKRVMAEREVMAMSHHPLIVSLEASFQSTDFLYHVMEYCPGGPLFGVLRRQPACHFDEDTAKFYVAECVLALEYLHMKGYMYRDLKPENILLSASGHIRLSDFDLVKPVQTDVTAVDYAESSAGGGSDGLVSLCTDDRATSFVGTAEYVAPEIVLRRPYGYATEWWSVGVLAFEMVCGYTPFVGANTQATFRLILSGKVQFPDANGGHKLTKDCKTMIRELLHKDATRRLGTKMGAAEVKAHRWLRNIKWSLLANTERPPFIPTQPLMPEAAEGADVSLQGQRNPTVLDRYRLFGKHFQSREEPDHKDAFDGFDWVSSNVDQA